MHSSGKATAMNKAKANWTVLIKTVTTAIQEGDIIMRRLLRDTGALIAQQLTQSAGSDNSATMRSALNLLDNNHEKWVRAFPAYLLEACAEVLEVDPYTHNTEIISGLGQLTINEDVPIQARSELTHLGKVLNANLEPHLFDLNGLISAARGHAFSQPDRNPLRPENYIQALQKMVYASKAQHATCLYLLKQMGAGLTPLLIHVYQVSINILSESGLDAAPRRSTGFAALTTGFGSIAPVEVTSQKTSTDEEEQLLTKNELLAALGNKAKYQVNTYTTGETDSPNTAHGDSTAADALDGEKTSSAAMNQQASTSAGAPQSNQKADSSIFAPSALLATHSLDIPSSLPISEPLTVDQLMARLGRATAHLLPLKELVAKIHPALRSLVQNDPAFLRTPSHPARQFVSTIEKLAQTYKSAQDPAFLQLQQRLPGIIQVLAQSTSGIKGSKPFERALLLLQGEKAPAQPPATNLAQERITPALSSPAPQTAQVRIAPTLAAKPIPSPDAPNTSAALDGNPTLTPAAAATPVPGTAENLLEHVTQHIRNLPEYASAHPRVQRFVTDPWAKVIVKHHINQTSAGMAPRRGAAINDSQGYLSLVSMLLASVQPRYLSEMDELDLAGVDTIWGKIKQGLGSVGVDPAKVDAAVIKLQQLHKSAATEALARATDFSGLDIFHESPAGAAIDLGLSAPAVSAATASASTTAAAHAANGINTANASAVMRSTTEQLNKMLRVGSVFRIETDDVLTTKLSWVSEDKTIFMFTSKDGNNQTMTRRRLLQLYQNGQIQVLKS